MRSIRPSLASSATMGSTGQKAPVLVRGEAGSGQTAQHVSAISGRSRIVVSDRQREIDDGLYEKWKEWIERIYDETVALFANRSYYRGLAEMTEGNDEIPPSSFFDAL